MVGDAGLPPARRLTAAVRAWAVWELPARVCGFVVAVIAVYAAAIAVAAAFTPFRLGNAGLFAFLLAFAAVSIELTRRQGQSAGYVRVTYAVWNLAIAVLLPPVYALLAPMVRQALSQGRVWRGLAYRRVFNSAAVGLSYGTASAAFHAILPGAAWRAPGLGPHALAWVAVVVACGVIQWAVNTTLVVTAVKGAESATSVRQMTFGREALFNDLAEFCTALVFAFVAASNVLLVVVTLPFVILLQRSGRHAELTHASRVDAKTGLLNAVTWQREAAVQVTRAVRTRTPLAVAMLDMDHFKLVNDTYGHLTGDLALTAVADTLRRGLRDYDLAGRFGGEEFAVLLPQTGQNEALVIAERIREQIAALTLPVRDAAAGPPLRLTVSIGIAAVTGSRLDLADLLAAADLALYQAKRAGRNMVCVVGDAPASGQEALGAAGAADL